MTGYYVSLELRDPKRSDTSSGTGQATLIVGHDETLAAFLATVLEDVSTGGTTLLAIKAAGLAAECEVDGTELDLPKMLREAASLSALVVGPTRPISLPEMDLVGVAVGMAEYIDSNETDPDYAGELRLVAAPGTPAEALAAILVDLSEAGADLVALDGFADIARTGDAWHGFEISARDLAMQARLTRSVAVSDGLAYGPETGSPG